MSRRAKVQDSDDKVSRVTGSFVAYTSRDGATHAHVGAVVTPLGIVQAQTWWDADRTARDATYLRFVWRGRSHWRVIARVYSERGLTTVAARFAREVSRGGAA